MPADPADVTVPLFIDVRVSLASGDVTARPPGPPTDAPDRVLLAGLGPLRSAAPHGRSALVLETAAGERWLVAISETSGLVASVDHLRPRACP